MTDDEFDTCPNCGDVNVVKHAHDCFSCRGDTARPCQACYGGYCGACGCTVLDGEPYSDDAPPEIMLAILPALTALGLATRDEMQWEMDGASNELRNIEGT